MEEKRCDVDLCRLETGETFACRIDLIDLIQECCPPNSATNWFLRALTRPGELKEKEATVTFIHDDTKVDVRGMTTEHGTYLNLSDFVILIQELRVSLKKRGESAPSNIKEKMDIEICETFDLLDDMVGDLTRALDDYFED